MVEYMYSKCCGTYEEFLEHFVIGGNAEQLMLV